MEAKIIEEDLKRVTRYNKHQSFKHRFKALTNLIPPDVSGESEFIEGLNAAVKAIQSLLDSTSKKGLSFRALGGNWSLSRVADTDGRLVNTKPLNWAFPLGEESISRDYPGGSRDGLFFAQCGVHVGELSVTLRKYGRALRTSGASNGQTIAGALSTGTHGSAFDVGATQDFVVAIHLITGPESQVWLERTSYPVASDELVASFGAERKRDDELFNAALVSFGSFGVIHAVIIETDPLYLLETYRKDISYDDALRRTITTLDFDEIELPKRPTRPYHFEVVINPHRDEITPRITTMYRLPYTSDYESPEWDEIAIGDDAMALMGFITDRVPGAIPTFINLTFNSAYPEFPEGGKKPPTGTHGEVFGNTTTRGTASAVAMGVPIAEADRALQALLGVHETDGPFPGLFSLRFVKGSSALLAFTRFPETAVVELDGVQSDQTTNFYKKTFKAFESLGIPFTLHWGKVNDYLTAARVRRMYEDRVERWIAARHKILSEKMRPVFTNAFMERCGLAD
jgi:hypothetical protein